MYKKGTYRIVENRPLTSNVYRMQVKGDTQWIVRPGQFVNIEIEGFYLRRPISICDYSDNTITLIYKVVGRGTEAMSHMQAGCELDMLTGLGNGFDPDVEIFVCDLFFKFGSGLFCAGGDTAASLSNYYSHALPPMLFL